MGRWIEDMHNNFVNLDHVIWIEYAEFKKKEIDGFGYVAHMVDGTTRQLTGWKGFLTDDQGYVTFDIKEWIEVHGFTP
jgi:hypothetical protein